jgi:hypothetical protein
MAWRRNCDITFLRGSAYLHTRLPSEVSPMKFVDWDHRPAVLVGDTAFAVLRPGGPWASVDRDDVWYTGGVMSEAAWRERFQGYFGPLDLSLIGLARAHIQYVNWDHRPAVLVGGKAFAGLAQGAPGVWKSVDRSAVIRSGLFMTERAWRRMFMGRFGRLNLFRQEARPTAEEFDDAARRLYAADLESKPTRHGFPGVAALILSRTLQQVAKDIGDGQLMLYAADMERRALGVIGLYLSCRLPNETAN